ncbi:hypothetical protein [Bradyrhizobium sp.]|jgi:hypothetical protein|uniref:hypothetical protein n=1 Tax=Bradyrhizobium sp. TaxID=376 RepID=UPI002DFD7446|nr:hypothetical protein [Bradyrhizobium sp.]
MTNDDFMQKRLAQMLEEARRKERSTPPGGRGEGPPEMPNDRVSKLEGAMDGLRHNQTILLGAVGLVLTVLIGFGFFGMNQLNQLNARVNELPAKVGADIRDLTKTLSEAITASKQQPPQIILMPTPQIPQASEPSKQ